MSKSGNLKFILFLNNSTHVGKYLTFRTNTGLNFSWGALYTHHGFSSEWVEHRHVPHCLEMTQKPGNRISKLKMKISFSLSYSIFLLDPNFSLQISFKMSQIGHERKNYWKLNIFEVTLGLIFSFFNFLWLLLAVPVSHSNQFFMFHRCAELAGITYMSVLVSKKALLLLARDELGATWHISLTAWLLVNNSSIR